MECKGKTSSRAVKCPHHADPQTTVHEAVDAFLVAVGESCLMTRVCDLCKGRGVPVTLRSGHDRLAQVSTREQNPDGQTDALEAAGCDKIFVEHASGTLAKRPALTEPIAGDGALYARAR